MKTRILWASMTVSGGVLLVMLLTRTLAVQAQGPITGPPGPWTRYDGNPVVVTGTAGSWDAITVADPAVISDGTTYKMWYSGSDDIFPSDDFSSSIGYATSTNGITWTKYSGNPILTGSDGSWDTSLGIAGVVFDGTTYHMWYGGFGGGLNGAIGYVTSTNGITWTRYSGNPVLQLGPPGSWDASWIVCPCVISDAALYKMWYTGVDNDGTYSVGYATSANGITWTKYSGNPVLQSGPPGSWERLVLCPDVVLNGTIYRMWYAGQDADGTQRIGYATSPDGVSWTKSPSNPVLGEGAPGSWEIKVGHPDVLLEGNTYKMWYTGSYTRSLVGLQIGYASASAIPLITTVVYSTLGGVITDTADLTTTIEIPAGTVTDTTTIVYSSLPNITVTPSPTLAFAGHAFSLDAYRNDVLILGFTFEGPVTITIEYSDGDVEGLIEHTLTLYHWADNTWADAACGDYDRDLEANVIRVLVCHLSDFALFGKEKTGIYLPIILKREAAFSGYKKT
jgi:predicted GH43/DUF377 family glycosyl hydrolase